MQQSLLSSKAQPSQAQQKVAVPRAGEGEKESLEVAWGGGR